MRLTVNKQQRPSSRQQMKIDGVKDGVLCMPGGRYCMALEVSAINFELKSEDEQDVLIDNYESFINSTSIPLQIVVRTRELDLNKYLEDFNSNLGDEVEPIYQDQVHDYQEFIHSLIDANRILTRHFYVVLSCQVSSKTEFEVVYERLNISSDIASRGLARLGIHSSRLDSLQLLELFYGLYSPAQAKDQPLNGLMLNSDHQVLIQKEKTNV